jgi:hypothetical protein
MKNYQPSEILEDRGEWLAIYSSVHGGETASIHCKRAVLAAV